MDKALLIHKIHKDQLLEVSYEEFHNHIDKQFTEGMNWNNYGEWHIDHIYPLSLFDKSTPINIVNALKNLKPMWATTRNINGILYEGNINKSNNI